MSSFEKDISRVIELLEEISRKLDEQARRRNYPYHNPLVGDPVSPDKTPPVSPSRPYWPYPDSTFNRTCRKCGITVEGAMGYVCPDDKCPTFARVTC